MSELTVAPAVLVTSEIVNNDVDLEGKAVSAKLEAFARLLDPFAEGSKFTAINQPGAAEEDSNATESETGAAAEENSGGDTKDGDVAKEAGSKVVTEDSKTDTTETTIKEHSAAAKVDEESPVVKKKRAPAQSKKATTDNEAIDDATDAKADGEAPVAMKKRGTPKAKKVTTDNEDIDDAVDVKVDQQAPVVKKKRASAKAKKATTDNEDIDDAADTKIDEEAPVAKKKRVLAKPKKAATDSEEVAVAADAKVDEEAPVVKKKRAPAKAKKATTDAADAKVDEEAPVAKKKRTTVKSKKAMIDNEDDDDATKTNLPITPPVTPPKKRGRKASTIDDADVNGSDLKPKASKKAKTTESPEDSTEVTTSQESPSTTKAGFKRKRAAVTKEKVVARGLPTSMKECSEADRMLLHMKDVDGKPWAEIRATWQAMTGQETAASTLPNRYNRLKVNLMALEEGDGPRLLSAKAEIDAEYADYIAKFTSDKWAKVQKAMEAQGTTNKYPSGFLQKEYQKLEAAGATEDDKDGDIEMADGEGSVAEGEEGMKTEE